jgi:hypothetical protein
MHYRRWSIYGDADFVKNIGRKYDYANGYVQILTVKGDGNKGKYVYEHRLITEEHSGRSLQTYESVRHNNGAKDDNRIENLELWSKAPAWLVSERRTKVRYAVEVLEQYAPELLSTEKA